MTLPFQKEGEIHRGGLSVLACQARCWAKPLGASACNGTRTVLIRAPVLGLIPFFSLGLGLGLVFFSLQPPAFPLMFQVFVSICQAGSGFRTGFHAKAFFYLMKTSE